MPFVAEQLHHAQGLDLALGLVGVLVRLVVLLVLGYLCQA
jgi:hypothetical protein